MTDDDLVTSMPKPRRLDDDARRRALAQFRAMVDTHDVGGRTRRRTRRRLIAVFSGAAGLAVGATAVAGALLDRTRPDPREAATVEAELVAPVEGDVHDVGWRQELNAELVQCATVGNDGDVQVITETWASQFPLAEPMTVQHLVAECAAGTDADEADRASSTPTACTRADAGVTPVVLLDGSPCEAATTPLRPLSRADMDELNRRRSFEVAVLAVPVDDGCPSFDEAHDWAVDRAADHAMRLEVIGESEGDGCYRGVTYWDRSVIWIQPLGPQAPSQ